MTGRRTDRTLAVPVVAASLGGPRPVGGAAVDVVPVGGDRLTRLTLPGTGPGGGSTREPWWRERLRCPGDDPRGPAGAVAGAPTQRGRPRALRDLYRGYADFYGAQQFETTAQVVWAWVRDPDHEVEALLVEDEHGRVAGLAHYRPFARPLAAATGCYLDDLFVEPSARGSGAADALLAELRGIATARGWSVVRWINAVDPGFTAIDLVPISSQVQSVDQGAAVIVRMAGTGPDGPTATSTGNDGPLGW